MNLPHLKPIRFVKELIKKEDNISLVSCEFPYIPTLSMVCEAAAQSSSSFNESKQEQLGFLISLKNIKLHKEFSCTFFNIKIEELIQVDKISEYSFEVIKNSEIYASGKLTIILGK